MIIHFSEDAKPEESAEIIEGLLVKNESLVELLTSVFFHKKETN